MSNIGDNLRIMRSKRGLSITNFAMGLAALGYIVSEQTVSRWERGVTKVPAQALELITWVLNCPVSSLIYTLEHQPQRSQLVLDTSGMTEHQKDSIRWLQRDWNGNMSTLLQFDLLYATLPQDIREEIAYTGIRLYQSALKANRIDFSAPRVDIGKIIKGWKEIADK